MSVIQRIQQRQKWVFGAIALALILFVVQDKLMSKGSITGNNTTIGKVNGEQIDYADFKSQEDLIKQMQQREVDENQLNDYVWQMLVNNAVINQEYKKLGLTYSMKEFGEDIGSNNPPDWFRQQFTDQATGGYNAAQAVNYINTQITPALKKSPNNPQSVAFNKGVLEPSVAGQLSKKYQGLITGAVYIPKWMADKTAADNSSIANISYVSIPYTTISDSAVKVSDDEITAYVQKHAKEYEQKDETRQIAYVTFDAYPSQLDTTAVVAQLTTLKGEFDAATDVKSFLEQKASPMAFYDSYLSKSQIHQPVNDTLFKMKKGEIFGPYKDGGNYVMAKLVDEKQWPDSATVRHILVATQQQDQQTGEMQRVREDTTASKRLDSAIAEIKAGVNFDSVCLKYSDDGTKTTGGVYQYFPTGKMVEQFNDFSFSGKVGESKKVETIFGFHYIQILGQKGSEPAYKFAYLAKAVTVSQETDDSAKNMALAFAGTSRNLKDFYANAAKIHKPPFSIPGIKENDYMVGNSNPRIPGGLGKNRQFVKWVYNNDAGSVSDPVRFDQKYVVAIITGVNKPGLPGVEAMRAIVEPIIRSEKKAKLIIETKIKGTTLEAIAQASNTTVQQVDSIAFQAQFIKGLGQEIKVLGAAFNKDLQGKISAPVAGQIGVFVIKGNGIAGIAPPQGGVDQQRTAAELNLRAQEGGGYGQQVPAFIQTLIKAATIKDYRNNFF